MSTESLASTSHSVSLTSLRPATTYYFRIRVGEEVFDNGGIPYSFKTKADTSAIIIPTQPVMAPSSAPIDSTKPSLTQCDTKTDYNKDGVINSVDLAVCKSAGGTVVSSSDSMMPVATPTIKKLSSMHFYGFERHLKTGMYYLRSKSKTTAAKFSIGANVTKKSKKSAKKQNPTEEEVLMCSIENKEACDLCTS
jgi:hypothetical protein